MKPGLRICQFTPIVNQGDAMSGQVVAIHRALEAANIKSFVYTNTLGNDDSIPKHLYSEYKAHPDNVILLNYGGRAGFEDKVLQLPGRVFVYYHNVTPPHFFARINMPWTGALARGRDSLPELAHFGGVAATEYNRQEMLRAGFRNVHVLPYFLDFERFTQAANTPAAREIIAQYRQPDITYWLHVGRIVPNKRIEDIVRAFYVYHEYFNANSNLLLVGSAEGFDAYYHPLQEWIANLGLTQAVKFIGQVNDRNQVAGFYKLADLYMCMSEHEGFCIPLLEAMVHEVPVIAFRSTGVTYTMGNAGVMVDDKTPTVLAAAAHLLCSNAAYRGKIIEEQLTQTRVWHPDKALEALYAWLETL
ncbi:MAG: glycosyltransferase [Anaerolineae bacterium]|nr:glycosyltransferase [Anaerolineae bacterium]